MPVDTKAQPAPGFPSEWVFYFDKDSRSTGHWNHAPVSGLYILSSGGKKFRSVEAAVAGASAALNENVRTIKQEFYTHVGLLDLLTAATDIPTSLSKYRVKDSRVYCKMGNEGHWGIVEESTKVGHTQYIFTVSIERCR